MLFADALKKKCHLENIRQILGKHPHAEFFLNKAESGKIGTLLKTDSTTDVLPRILPNPQVSESHNLLQIKACEVPWE